MTLVLVLGSFDTSGRMATFEPSRADLDAARRGDRLAFARLFEGFAPMVHGVLSPTVRRPRSTISCRTSSSPRWNG